MIVSMKDCNIEMVVAAWNEGFSDYIVPVHMDKEMFQKRMDKYDLSLDLSAVFLVDQQYAGVILLGTRIFQDKTMMWVGGMSVVPAFRKHHIASQLMDYADEIGKEHGYDEIRLEVISSNTRAKSLYDKKGYEVVNELAIGILDINNQVQNAEINFIDVELHDILNKEEYLIPWQNRMVYISNICKIYGDQIELGYIGYEVVDMDEKKIGLHHLHLYQVNDVKFLSDILLALKKKENAIHFALRNYNMMSKEYNVFKTYQIEISLTQYQMIKKIKS